MRRMLLASAAATLAVTAASTASAAPTIIRQTATATVWLYSTGFNNPRNLRFSPSGVLYVAEGGAGGTASTVGLCTQVVPPLGPYTGSARGGRISWVDSNGNRNTVTDRFPSSQTTSATGSLTSGVADIAWLNGQLYALTAGSGCSHGVINTTNGIFRVNANGNPVLLADLSAFQKAHPVKNPEPDDFEPDGTWWSLAVVGSKFYAVEPNHGELDSADLRGTVTRIADISATQGHIVPTAMTYHNGLFTVGNLNTFPIVPGSSKILRISQTGQVQVAATGFTTILGVAYDKLGRLYVLENTTTAGNPTPGEGDIVRINAGGTRTVIIDGLALPTGMTFGPDGALYVSNLGFGPPPSLPNGPGQVLKITFTN
jgi:hypothetical protein